MHYCHANTVCVNLPGSYRCNCVPGYIRIDDFSCTVFGKECEDLTFTPAERILISNEKSLSKNFFSNKDKQLDFQAPISLRAKTGHEMDGVIFVNAICQCNLSMQFVGKGDALRFGITSVMNVTVDSTTVMRMQSVPIQSEDIVAPANLDMWGMGPSAETQIYNDAMVNIHKKQLEKSFLLVQ
ncbi:hypothetical protein L345_14237, partial [Ophiophagus hannah]